MTKQIIYTEMELADGESAKLTLAYRFQRILERQKPEAFEAYSRVATKGVVSELDVVAVLYAAYCCGCYAQGIPADEIMDQDGFDDSMPPRKAMYEALASVMGPNA